MIRIAERLRSMAGSLRRRIPAVPSDDELRDPVTGSQKQPEDAIRAAITFLRRRQTPEGEILTARGERADLSDAVPDGSIFTTANALHSLAYATAFGVDDVCAAAAGFLVREREPGDLWRYWSRRNERSAHIPVDADDTACAAFAARAHHPEVFRGSNVARLLRARTPEGLFLTWLEDPEPFGWANDVDAVVNANVLLYLGDREETKPVSAYLSAIVEENREAGSYRYYFGDLALHYAVSRAFAHGCDSLAEAAKRSAAKVARRIEEHGAGNELEAALALSTLVDAGIGERDVLDRLARSLCESQQEDGSWRRHAYWQGAAIGYYGSEELVTALCVEALCLHPGRGGS